MVLGRYVAFGYFEGSQQARGVAQRRTFPKTVLRTAPGGFVYHAK